MSDTKAPPIIFDENLLTLRRDRAAKRGPSFLMQRCLEDAAERLMDVNRNFENVLILGSKDLETYLRAKLPPQKLETIITCETVKDLPSEGDFDLAMSCLRLQSENDLPGAIIQLHHKLKADGLFIASMFGGDTLSELRQVFYKTDENLLGGLTPHIYPMADYSQAAGLLSRAGLNQPVIDTDRFTVTYSRLERLISDLRDLGETNVMHSRHGRPLTRGYLTALEQNYKKNFYREDGKFICSFEILWLTGWAPHESQQKPLKPGSATVSLAEGLLQSRKNKG